MKWQRKYELTHKVEAGRGGPSISGDITDIEDIPKSIYLYTARSQYSMQGINVLVDFY